MTSHYENASAQQQQQFVATGAVSEQAGDFLRTINDVTGDQEKLNFTLGTLIYERK